MFIRKTLSVVAALAFSAAIAYTASIPLLPGPQDPSQLNATVNTVIQQINSLITPTSMASYGTPRNLLDNGAMNIQQRGTGTATCGTTSGVAVASYGPDRWGCNVNVTSGAGQLTPVSSSPTPPTGFKYVTKLVRNSGALTQPQCVWQEVASARVVSARGQYIMLSAYMEALAGLNADNSNAVSLVIITGTGTDEGLGALRSATGMTASPAITPAWTGVATLQTTTATLSASAWTRVNGAAVFLPTTATELAVGFCFTPTATGAGTTDGFAFTGAQLEVVLGTATAPSSFEFIAGLDLLRSQRLAYVINEAGAGVVQVGGGTAQGTTTTCTAYIPFPATMEVAPVYTNALSATTFKVVSASQTATVLGTPFSATLAANTVNGASINFTTTGMTAKDGCFIVGAAGGGVMLFSADF